MTRANCLGTDNLVQKAFWNKMTGCMAKYYGSERIKKHKIQSQEGFPVSSAQTAKHSVLLENKKISIFANPLKWKNTLQLFLYDSQVHYLNCKTAHEQFL